MKAILIVVGLVAFFAAGVVATLLITGWDSSDDDVAAEPVAITVTSTAPERDDPLAPACEVVWYDFETMMDRQERLLADIDYHINPLVNTPKSLQDRLYDEFFRDNRGRFEALHDETDVLVSKSASLVNDGNPFGQALLDYALSSRSITAWILEDSTSEWDPVLDDADEFRAYEEVLARCEAASG